MKKFDEKIKSVKKTKRTGGYICLVIAVIFIMLGMLLGNDDKDLWEKFNENSNENQYCKTNISYLVGPFAEVTEDGQVTERLYIAFYETKNYIKSFIVSAGKNTNLPIWGEDITEENIDNIKPVTIYGCSKKTEKETAEFLVKFANELYETDEVTLSNYDEYFGKYYLDTTDQNDGIDIAFYIIGVLFGSIAIISIFSNKKTNKNANETLKKLEENGDLQAFKEEYERDSTVEYKKIKLAITENYIFSYNNEILIIPFSDIINAYCSNMIEGVYQQFRYIVLETKNDKKYYIAQKAIDAKIQEFDEALNKIKSKVKMGGF